MNDSVYLVRGSSRIGSEPIDQSFHDFLCKRPLAQVNTEALEPSLSLGLVEKVCKFSDKVDGQNKFDRMFNKTTESQSRNLVHIGYDTWEKIFDGLEPTVTAGLFMGLATVDCDDDKKSDFFASSERQVLADTMLSETKPLSGLILLNSTACSHLAKHLNITGPNIAFSPHSDAGSCAIAEAYYAVLEKRCGVALCGGGSQTINPWYFMQYETAFRSRGIQDWFPCEAASFFMVQTQKDKADGRLIDVKRTFVDDTDFAYRELDNWLQDKDVSQIKQTIHVGGLSFDRKLHSTIDNYIPGINQFHFDSFFGYTGPAGAFLALNMALEMFRGKWNVSQEVAGSHTLFGGESQRILITVAGLEGQLHYILVGEN